MNPYRGNFLGGSGAILRPCIVYFNFGSDWHGYAINNLLLVDLISVRKKIESEITIWWYEPLSYDTIL